MIPCNMSNTLNTSSRIGWIDTLKGIGILTVVAGHIFPETAVRYLFLFHMPLFIFIGGFLFKPSADWKEYLTKKAFHLLVPYVAFLCLVYVPYEMREIFTGKETIAKGIVRPFLGGRYLIGWAAVFWYVTCFFLVQQVMNFLVNKVSKKIIGLLMLVSLVISYAINKFLPSFGLPWNADVVFAALPIFYLGYLYKGVQGDPGKYKWMIFVLLAVVVTFTYYYPANTYGMKNGEYGIPFVTLASSLVIILSLIELVKIISKYPLVSKPFNEFGIASMVVMYLHQPIQFIALEHLHIVNPFARFFIALVLSMGGYYLLNSFAIGRALFMGSLPDFKKVFRREKLATV
ncbi:fucose 4-O-acetylase-like acetyltransferase [Chitinophaga sp. S165]|nr:fucose 4-O-acetylase-like acetyltransferase [Chitinophaga sp. S165]